MIERSENELQYYGAQGAVFALRELAKDIAESSDDVHDPEQMHVAAEFIHIILATIPLYERVVQERGPLVHEELKHERHEH